MWTGHRVSLALGVCLLAAGSGCGEESTATAADCRQESERCTDGFSCVESGGDWECLPVRDARVGDQGVAEDAEVSADGEPSPEPVDGSLPAMDMAFPPSLDMGPPLPDMRVPDEDMATPDADMTLPVEDMAVPVEDMAAPVEDMAVPVADMDSPQEDMAPPAMDMDPPMEDMALPVEDMALPAPDMEAPDRFGMGRCNHQRRIEEDDAFEPNPDQNSARPIPLGRSENLILRAGDSDWYRFEGLCMGGTFSIVLEHPFDGGDLDLQVWAGREGRVIHSQGFCTGREEGRFDIPQGVDRLTIGVYPFGPPGQPGGANTYTLDLRMACP